MNSRRLHRLALIAACYGFSTLAAIGLAQSWTPSGPIPRAFHTAVLDTATNRMIVFAGQTTSSNQTGSSGNQNDVWLLHGAGGKPLIWTRLRPTGTAPARRNSPTAVYDPGSNRMITFGGGLGSASPCANDVWALTNANGNGGTPEWVQLSPAGSPPQPRLRHTAVYDLNTNTMIVFGGNDCFSTNFADVWLLLNANGLTGTPTWAQLFPSGTGPGPLEDHTAVYDPGSNTMIVFGGAGPSNAVWTLSNANGTGGTPAWTELSPSGTPPSGRTLSTAVYDATNNRMTIFGGNAGATLFGDVWVLSNANGVVGTPAWTPLGPFTTYAEARSAQTAVYDPSTNQMVVFGGDLPSGDATNDVWMLSHANGL